MITIKTATNCPTCGAECRVEGAETPRYSPIAQIDAWNTGYKAGLKSDHVDMSAAMDRIAELEAQLANQKQENFSDKAYIAELKAENQQLKEDNVELKALWMKALRKINTLEKSSTG